MGETEVLSIEDAAVGAGVPLHVFIGLLCDSGLLLVADWGEDCSEFWGHVEGCGCAFVASPHPDIQELP